MGVVCCGRVGVWVSPVCFPCGGVCAAKTRMLFSRVRIPWCYWPLKVLSGDMCNGKSVGRLSMSLTSVRIHRSVGRHDHVIASEEMSI
jgi:hypothetical protein